MSDKTKPSDEDRKLFREAMRDVAPLAKTHKSHASNTPPKPAPVKHTPSSELESSLISLTDNYQQSVTIDEKLFFARPGISPKTLKLLRHGKYPVSQRLDLHGNSIEMARTRLVNALTSSYQNQVRCILLIHGKSHRPDQIPILKNYINHWLPQIPFVLAFYSAIPADGGTGAMYVLLKRMH